LRLAVVSPFVDNRHGTERALAELLQRLASDYHCEIHLYAERVEDLALTDRKSGSLGKTGVIVWHKVPSLPGPHLVKFLFWMFSNTLQRYWDHLFRRLSFDLVLSPGINAWNADVIIVHSVFRRLQELSQDGGARKAQRSGVLRELHRRAYYGLLSALERRIYSNRRTALAAVSQRTADLLARYFQRGDVRVIPNGVDCRQFSASARLARRGDARKRRNLSDADFVLLLIGNDWRVKGVPEVLAAMGALPALPLRVIVAGNDAAQPFRETAERLHVQDRCRWEGPRSDVLDLYAAADVYVSPSHEDSFGLPVAEAMACGLPAITSACAGVSALIRDGVDGFVLHDPADKAALVRIFEQLYSDEALRQRISEAAMQTAQQWTWDRSAAEVWALLQEVTRSSRPAAFPDPN
jgi:UDP-glucose:(heptosyl)LPS alpha-1,3-glucosyltransferase